MEKVPMTKDGYEKLKKDLYDLKTVERPKVIAAIEVARGHGDLSENADYDAAKERQSFIEGRIAEMEDRMARAEIIDTKGSTSDKVLFGAKVTLQNLETDETVSYILVGEHEADIKEGKISIKSPLGRELIGKRADDMFDVNTPKGEKSYQIKKIEY